MNIVKGRGKNRIVIELPCGYIVAKSAKNEPENYAGAINTLCDLLNIRKGMASLLPSH